MKPTHLLISCVMILCAGGSQAKDYESKRPTPENRLFKSTAVENKITWMKTQLKMVKRTSAAARNVNLPSVPAGLRGTSRWFA